MYLLALCDDDKKILDELKIFFENNYTDMFHISTFTDVDELEKFVDAKNIALPDFIIMDIQFHETEKNDITGIEKVLELQTKYPKLKIIYLTGYLKYATDIFKTSPSYFLTKPIDKKKLTEAIDKVIGEIEASKRNSFSIITKGKATSIPINDILFIESCRHSIIIHTINGQKITYRKKLDQVIEPHQIQFLRVHQSYAVNIAHINKLTRTEALLTNDILIPISRKRYASARKKFMVYLMGK